VEWKKPALRALFATKLPNITGWVTRAETVGGSAQPIFLRTLKAGRHSRCPVATLSSSGTGETALAVPGC